MVVSMWYLCKLAGTFETISVTSSGYCHSGIGIGSDLFRVGIVSCSQRRCFQLERKMVKDEIYQRVVIRCHLCILVVCRLHRLHTCVSLRQSQRPLTYGTHSSWHTVETDRCHSLGLCTSTSEPGLLWGSQRCSWSHLRLFLHKWGYTLLLCSRYRPDKRVACINGVDRIGNSWCTNDYMEWDQHQQKHCENKTRLHRCQWKWFNLPLRNAFSIFVWSIIFKHVPNRPCIQKAFRNRRSNFKSGISGSGLARPSQWLSGRRVRQPARGTLLITTCVFDFK